MTFSSFSAGFLSSSADILPASRPQTRAPFPTAVGLPAGKAQYLCVNLPRRRSSNSGAAVTLSKGQPNVWVWVRESDPPLPLLPSTSTFLVVSCRPQSRAES